MPLLSSTTAREFNVHGVVFESFACTASGAAQLGAWCAAFAPRTFGRPHRMSAEEVLLVLDGRLSIDIDGDRFDAAAGDAVLVPAGSVFTVDNETGRPARAWVTTSLGMTATMESDGTRFTPPWAQ